MAAHGRMDGMASMAVTRHEMTRRREQLQDLQRYLAVLEADHDGLRAKLLGFRLRYLDALGPLMRELDELEAQLHQATGLLSEALKRQGVDVPVPALPRAKAWPDVPALPDEAASLRRFTLEGDFFFLDSVMISRQCLRTINNGFQGIFPD